VHRELSRVISRHSVDDDLDFVVREKAIRAPSRLRLRRTGREHEERGDTDDEGEESFLWRVKGGKENIGGKRRRTREEQGRGKPSAQN
jgi:hypothetical protein